MTRPKKVASHNLYLLLYTKRAYALLSLLVFLSAREQLNKLTIAEKEATEGKETKKAIQ